MGFLSAYEGTRRVPIGDPSRGYWIELREVLSQGAKEKAERALSRKISMDGNVESQLDTVAYRQEMVLASIVGWNLDDDNGVVWPINMQNLRRLPGAVYEQVWKVVNELNSPDDAEERRRFPDGSDVSDSVGVGGTAESGDVLA